MPLDGHRHHPGRQSGSQLHRRPLPAEAGAWAPPVLPAHGTAREGAEAERGQARAEEDLQMHWGEMGTVTVADLARAVPPWLSMEDGATAKSKTWVPSSPAVPVSRPPSLQAGTEHPKARRWERNRRGQGRARHLRARAA